MFKILLNLHRQFQRYDFRWRVREPKGGYEVLYIWFKDKIFAYILAFTDINYLFWNLSYLHLKMTLFWLLGPLGPEPLNLDKNFFLVDPLIFFFVSMVKISAIYLQRCRSFSYGRTDGRTDGRSETNRHFFLKNF